MNMKYDKELAREIEAFESYMQGKEWQRLKQSRFELDQCCVLCKSKENTVCHHLTYSRLYNEDINDLITLCSKCHARIHKISPPTFIPDCCRQDAKEKVWTSQIDIEHLKKEMLKIDFG